MKRLPAFKVKREHEKTKADSRYNLKVSIDNINNGGACRRRLHGLQDWINAGK